jgi:hypothetical protein
MQGGLPVSQPNASPLPAKKQQTAKLARLLKAGDVKAGTGVVEFSCSGVMETVDLLPNGCVQHANIIGSVHQLPSCQYRGSLDTWGFQYQEVRFCVAC